MNINALQWRWTGMVYYAIYYNRYAQVFNEDCLIKLG